MTKSNGTSYYPGCGRDAAALTLIPVRRADGAATLSPKAGDLTTALKQRVGTPILSSTQEQEKNVPAATSVPIARRAAELPKPYLAPEAELTPTYIVGTPRAVFEASPPPLLPPPLPYDDIRNADELVYYWDELRANRALPVLADIDRTRVAISWPNTLLVTFGADRTGTPQVTRLSRFSGAAEVTTGVTEWILSSSRRVAEIGKAMETERAFTGARNTRRYHLILLPFASAGGASEHVLCHFSCAD